MTTNDHTATDYAAGLRALADFLEAAGLPASVRFPTLPLGIQLDVTSAEAVKDYALAHDLPVTERRHTKTVVALGPTPDTYHDGSIELTVVYVPDEPEDAAAEEPEQATGVDTYDCPEPDCDYSVSAVGTPGPDEPNEFAEDIEQHERGHAEAAAADPTGALTAPPGVELVTSPSWTPEARQLLTDQFAALAATGSVALAPSPQDGVAPLWFSDPASAIAPPALVQLDQDDAGHRVIAAALAFDELDDRREGLDVAGVDAWDTAREGLRQALADFREVN